jgi:hypothetical protein
MTEVRRYRAYLVRLWQAENEDGRLVWRAALEDARGGERHGFADLTQLCVSRSADSELECGRRASTDARGVMP